MDPENKARNDIVSLLIMATATKLPIKRSDMVEVVDKLIDFNKAFQLAEENLKSIYGILLSVVPNKKNTKSVKKYICYAEEKAHSVHECDEEQQRDTTLLFLLLSYIFMIGRCVSESELEGFLRGLEIDWDVAHPYFGSEIKKLINDTFTKQLYLIREKCTSSIRNIKYIYSWGYRSEVEFEKKDVLEATAKILGKPAELFVKQYKEAYPPQDDEITGD